MNVWHDISPKRITPDKFVCYIEITSGTKQKYELDKETGLLILDRVLYTSTHYPANYGLIPRTLGEDGDPLDVLVLCSQPIQSQSLVECYPIGVITMSDGGEMDEKILALPLGDPANLCYKSIFDMPEHLMKEMEHFFTVYKELENKKTFVSNIEGPEKAKEVINRSISAYIKAFN